MNIQATGDFDNAAPKSAMGMQQTSIKASMELRRRTPSRSGSVCRNPVNLIIATLAARKAKRAPVVVVVVVAAAAAAVVVVVVVVAAAVVVVAAVVAAAVVVA